MGALFGKKRITKPASRVTEQDRAVLQLKTARDNIHSYQKKIKLNLAKERLVAKSLIDSGEKGKALKLLKKKRYQETLLENTANQIDRLEQLVQDLEFSQIEVEIVKGLKIGNDALTELHKIMTLEDVEQILDDTAEGIEYQRQIDELVAGNLNNEDEEEVLKEYSELIDDQNVHLPEVPTDKIQEIQPNSVDSERSDRILVEAI